MPTVLRGGNRVNPKVNIMKGIFQFILCQFLLCLFAHRGAAQASSASQREGEFDKIISEQFKPNETGCVALVAEQGKIIYKKAFGMANIELNVPMKANMVFRLGSISKQFTAISILQLMEKGKLTLQDKITTHISDYPKDGNKITIEHLLTHTSGIVNITRMKNFGNIKRKSLTTPEVIDFFKNEPLEFEPGTRWSYSNSGYILLGYIVEKVSGLAYGQYLEENIFKPCQMTASSLDDDSKIIKNRASGYAKNGDQTVNAEFISMTIPHGAGGIVSTVEDLYRWNRALITYKLVTKSTLEKAFERHKLSDGKDTDYGYGWFFLNIQGHPTVEHGGGIEGFLTSSIYLRKEDTFVAVFSNSSGQSPEFVSSKLAAVSIGKPYLYKEVTLERSLEQSYVGVYENDEGILMNIYLEDGKMYSEFPDGNKIQLKPYDKGKYFYHDFFSTLEFKQSADNKISSADAVSRFEKSRTWKRTRKPFTSRAEVSVPETMLEQYVGDYQVSPSFTLTIVKDGNKLFAQGPGQPKQELFGESQNKFYLKTMPIQVEFCRNSSGKVEKLAIYQGDNITEAMKVK
jgi:CubicO group peptidase (beta-lactamase class C family)